MPDPEPDKRRVVRVSTTRKGMWTERLPDGDRMRPLSPCPRATLPAA